MDDLIVIILTILITVVGAISQIKKKKRLENSTVGADESKNEPGFWETMLDNEELIPIQNHYDDYHSVEDNSEVVESNEPVFDSVAEERTSVFADDISKKNGIKESEIGLESESSKLMDGFSLRKAIIYSEIIQTKYL
jgi:hypothetical protein